MTHAGMRIEIRGTVQGVGFRPYVYRLAHEAGVTGRVRNDAAGVTIEAFGDTPRLASFVDHLMTAPPPAAAIREITVAALPAEDVLDFVIVASATDTDRRVSIPADLATCSACLAEIMDPANRRYRYPFTNCTDCGPRFTIAHDVPYDRPLTTMAGFTMCPECAREYHDPRDRRFHAQPNACRVCGPRLQLVGGNGFPIVCADPLDATARALADGKIVALKGLGGFHLACDATSSATVQRLRERKRREEKPFAVMVRDLATARRLAVVGPAEEALLTSIERPIVLLERRADAGPLAPCAEVAPHNGLLGLMLPYTPLHHLLLAAVERPLVMTSANLTDEPICYRNDEAQRRLAGIADLVLVHDREIATRCDDSVGRVIAGAPVVLRRSRGYVPRPITLRHPVDQPVLACGAQLKNTFCLAVGDSAFLGPHVGDLETLEAYDAYRDAIEKLERFIGVTPELVACDMHPEYLSTRYARERSGDAAIAVQHHHAHVVSALAEHGIEGPVLGLAWDGTGYGTDGTAWGGELHCADARGFERLATFRPLALAGADRAIREPWRLALALLIDAYGDSAPIEVFPLFAHVPAGEVAVVTQMLARDVNAPLARGVGRYFDAVGALVLARPLARYEGQVALEWNVAADPAVRDAYPFEMERNQDGLLEVDVRPATRAIVEDLRRGAGAAAISGRFHNTLAAAAAAMVHDGARCTAVRRVVLTGGCFQNALLAERTAATLAPDCRVLLHRDVPPGDGGIALGQAVIADAVTRRGRESERCV